MSSYGDYIQDFSNIPTYSISIVGQTPPANATDLFIMSGSSTTGTVVRITYLSFYYYAQTNNIDAYPYDFYIIKRSTDDTGGTSTNQLSNIISFDSNNSASTINVMRSYTANPSSLGTGAGTFKYLKSLVHTNLSYSWTPREFPQFEAGPFHQPMTLRGSSEFMALNFTGASLGVSATWYLNVVWTED